MSHQVQIDYEAIAIRCESICEVAEKQIAELDEDIAKLERQSLSLSSERAKSFAESINRERNEFHRRIEELLSKAKEIAEKGVVSRDSDRLRLNSADNVDKAAQELQNQVNELAAKRLVEMHALYQSLLESSIEENQKRLREKANGVIIIPAEIQKLLDSIQDETERQFTYLAYLKNDTISGDDLIRAGKELKSETYKSRIEKEREKIRRELEAARVEKTTIDKVVTENKPLSEIRSAATEEIVGEKIRQKSLKIIMSAITARGFIVDKKNIKIKRDTNEVILVGLKASGEKAEFRVFLDGKFIYDFRGYEGQACQKDIQPFLNDLEEVYGLHVTKTQEIWSNPDKISSMKYQTVKTNTNKR